MGTPNALDVTHVADLVVRSFWSGKMKEYSPINIDHSEMPSANLFIANFGVDGTLEHELQGNRVPLRYNFFPADSVSLLTSMATSRVPREHGIVGREWYVDDAPVEAYSDYTTFSSSVSFPNMIDAEVITASADKQLGNAISQGVKSIDTLSNGNFESHHGLSFTKEEALRSIREHSFWKKYEKQLKTLDLNDEKTISFIMEMGIFED